MANANKLIVDCVNGLNSADIKKAPYLIYLLKTPDGIYVGETNDLVTRWNAHNNSAVNDVADRGCNEKLKQSLRLGNVRVYVVATAITESEARGKEALAIEYYGANLNSRNEMIRTHVQASFGSLDNISSVVTLMAKRDHGNNDKYSDSDRALVFCKIVMEKSRKRVLCCEGVYVGLYVECSRSEREKFNVGDRVKIKAAVANNSEKRYLVAAKTSPLLKA